MENNNCGKLWWTVQLVVKIAGGRRANRKYQGGKILIQRKKGRNVCKSLTDKVDDRCSKIIIIKKCKRVGSFSGPPSFDRNVLSSLF